MTASSVDFFPCRVQLMGLPQSTTTSIQANTRRPSLTKVQGVSRNLFGTPNRSEINNIFQEDSKRQRSYVLHRYNFDINPSKHLDKNNTHLPTDSFNTNNTCQPSKLPTLIEQELQQHEQRLQKEKCNINRVMSDNIALKHTSSKSNALRSCCEDVSSTILSSAEKRHKPYARQTFLTERFSLRKNKIGLTSNNQRDNAEVNPLKCLNSHRNLEVVQLPQALQAQEHEVSTTNDNKCVDDNTNTKTSSSNCTTLSLKFTISSKNTSSSTTQSASNAHKHS